MKIAAGLYLFCAIATANLPAQGEEQCRKGSTGAGHLSVDIFRDGIHNKALLQGSPEALAKTESAIGEIRHICQPGQIIMFEQPNYYMISDIIAEICDFSQSIVRFELHSGTDRLMCVIRTPSAH